MNLLLPLLLLLFVNLETLMNLRSIYPIYLSLSQVIILKTIKKIKTQINTGLFFAFGAN